MASQDDVRRIAMALPGVIASKERFAFSVDHKGKAKGFVWVWQERIHPKKPRVPNPQVLAARVADQTEKASLLGAAPDKFFTEPHYAGFPAVLVRLPAVSVAELRQVVTEAWRCQAPKQLVAAYDAGAAAAPKAPATPPAATSRTARPRTARPRTGKPSITPPGARSARDGRGGRRDRRAAR